jgi:hypothetical protein
VPQVWGELDVGGIECGDFFLIVSIGGMPILQVADLVEQLAVLGKQTGVVGRELVELTLIVTLVSSHPSVAGDESLNILDWFTEREDVEYCAKLVSNERIGENECNIAVSGYVRQKDTREKIDIHQLNADIAGIVKREQELRTQIDAIVADLEAHDDRPEGTHHNEGAGHRRVRG